MKALALGATAIDVVSLWMSQSRDVAKIAALTGLSPPSTEVIIAEARALVSEADLLRIEADIHELEKATGLMPIDGLMPPPTKRSAL
jgi:hypothetical protein